MKSKQLSISALALVSTGGLLFVLYFGAALFQEPDTLDIVKAAIALERTNTDAAIVNSNANRVLVRSSTGVTPYLERQGWTRTNQFGALGTYRKGNQQLYANCGMYSRRYMICSLTIPRSGK